MGRPDLSGSTSEYMLTKGLQEICSQYTRFWGLRDRPPTSNLERQWGKCPDTGELVCKPRLHFQTFRLRAGHEVVLEDPRGR